MTKVGLGLIAALALSGCVAPGSLMSGPGDATYLLVKTNPTAATITFTDGTTCETPCRVGVVDPVEMTVARIGHDPVVRRIDQQTRSPLTITLKPVGRSVGVEEIELPDL